MRIEKIKEIIKLLENSSLESLEITEDTDTLKISKGDNRFQKKIGHHSEEDTAYQEHSEEKTIEKDSVLSTENSENKKIECKENQQAITSPMVGVFYQAPNPKESPFVEVGDRVEKGQVVCIIEAMKLMNEIQATESGEIAEICVENGKPVQYGQPLFYLK